MYYFVTFNTGYIVLRQQNFSQNFTRKFPENFGTKVWIFESRKLSQNFESLNLFEKVLKVWTSKLSQNLPNVSLKVCQNCGKTSWAQNFKKTTTLGTYPYWSMTITFVKSVDHYGEGGGAIPRCFIIIIDGWAIFRTRKHILTGYIRTGQLIRQNLDDWHKSLSCSEMATKQAYVCTLLYVISWKLTYPTKNNCSLLSLYHFSSLLPSTRVRSGNFRTGKKKKNRKINQLIPTRHLSDHG